MTLKGAITMQTLTQKIIDAGFKERILTNMDLSNLLNGTPASQYALVNKALSTGELVRLRRGLYILAKKYNERQFSQFILANHIIPYSYISLESALSYYDWIPERVRTTLSIISNGNNKLITNIFGDFEYYRISIKPFEFLTGILRETLNDESFLIASPLRALTDYVYIHKMDSPNIDYLQYSLRIEIDKIMSISFDSIQQLKEIYRSKRVLSFLNNLAKSIKKL
jgi:predicted transcriptional regulator of viral defense system